MDKEKTIIFLTSSRPLGRNTWKAMREIFSKLHEETGLTFVMLPYSASVVTKKELRKVLKGLLDD